MEALRLDPRKTALVLIDLQNGIVSAPAAPHASADVVANARLLAEALRKQGGTVVFVRVDMASVLNLPVDIPARDPQAALLPSSASELVQDAGFVSGDLLVTKRHWGAFAGTDLEQLLRERGIDTVVLGGISTNIGVESTARQGTGLGFAFVIVEDASSARDADAHRYSFDKIFPRLGRVRKTQEVVAALESNSH